MSNGLLVFILIWALVAPLLGVLLGFLLAKPQRLAGFKLPRFFRHDDEDDRQVARPREIKV